MKKLVSLLVVIAFVTLLSACGKDIQGNYYSFDDKAGKVNLKIHEKTATMTMMSYQKAVAEKDDSFLGSIFSTTIDPSTLVYKGKIDEKKKTIKFGNGRDSYYAKYELDGDTIIVNMNDLGKMHFNKKDTEQYKDAANNFDEEVFIQSIQ